MDGGWKVQARVAPLKIGVLRRTGIVLLLQAGGVVGAYLGQATIARCLGVVEYGEFRYWWSWLLLLSTLGTLGFPAAFQRFVPEYVSRSDWRKLKGLIAGARGATVVFGGGLGALLGWGLRGEGDQWPVWVGCVVGVTGMVLLVTSSHLARSLGHLVLAFGPLYLGRAGAVFMAGAVCAGGDLATAGMAAALVAAGLGIVGVAQGVALRAGYPSELRVTMPEWAWGEWLRVALPLLGITGMALLLDQLGVLLIRWLSVVEEVGKFGVVVQTGMVVRMYPGAMNMVVAPQISRLFHSGMDEELAAYLKRVRSLFIWPTLSVGVILLGMGHYVLGVFGEAFVSRDVLIALALVIGGNVWVGISGPASAMLNVTGHQDLSAALLAIGVASGFGVGFLLIPDHGVVGAGCGFAVAMVVWNIGLLLAVKRYFRKR